MMEPAMLNPLKKLVCDHFIQSGTTTVSMILYICADRIHIEVGSQG